MQAGGVVAGGGVPGDGDGLAGDPERDGTLDGRGGAVARLPVPKTCLATSVATSMLHLDAYCSMTCSAVAPVPVVTRAMPKPGPGLSRTMTTVTGREPNTEYHRQLSTAAPIVSVLP